MKLQAGNLEYEWIENWGNRPKADGFAHHGMAISADGTIYTADGAQPKIVVMDQDGNLLREFTTPVTENHCIALADDNGTEVLWLSDTSQKGGVDKYGPARVIKCDLDGNELAQITADDLEYTEDECFIPTAVSIDPNSGDIYIANGYGTNKIHCVSPDLKLKWTSTGSAEDEGGPFKQPHWIFCDTRKGHTEIYVADRRNHQVQVFDTNGNFVRVIKGFLETPSAFSAFGKYLVIGELMARLVILDENDELVGYLGSGKEHCKKEGWPNRKDADGTVNHPLDDIPVGEFNSPHGVVANANGDIFVSEWLLGDRFIKLKRVS